MPATPSRLPWLVTLAVVAACADRAGPAGLAPSAASLGQSVTVCHRSAAPRTIGIAPAALRAHLAHGDHLARLVVDPADPRVGDGVHFARITDAVDAVRAVRLARGERTAAACRITIEVAAGRHLGTFDGPGDATIERYPIILDVPDLTLRGALRIARDARGRALLPGPAVPTTLLEPDRPLDFLPVTEAMILVVGHPGGSVGSGAVIEGFTFGSARTDGSAGGMAIISLRAPGLVVRGSAFGPGLSSALDAREGGVVAEANVAEGLGPNCALCLVGPGRLVARDNRIVDGGLGAIYVGAAIAHLPFSLGAAPVTDVAPAVLPSAAAASARIENNLVTGHRRLPIGFALRMLGIGPASSGVPQETTVEVVGNEFTGNTFNLVVDAGFPMNGTLRRGDVSLRLEGNTIHGGCQRDLLVAFTRHTGALGVTTNPYLLSSTYRLDLGGDLRWDDAWFAHPTGFGNRLLVEGQEVPHGAVVAYDPARPCP